MKIVIVGGVAGGASAAARARRLDENAEIILLQSGPDISFASCGMPYYIGGEIQDRSQMAVQTPASLKARLDIDVRVHTRVAAIDTANRTVTTRSEVEDDSSTTTLPYDHLVLAVGAEPFRPPIKGINRPGLFALRNLEDMDAIAGWIAERQPRVPEGRRMHCVVAGAGFVGLEMVEQLVRRDIKVSLVEMLPQVLGPLDEEMAAIVQSDLEKRGVDVIVGDPIAEFRPEDEEDDADPDGMGSTCLVLKSGRVLPPAEMTILGLGVRPDTAVAKKAGIEVTKRGHIVVDDHLKTNVPNVWAVGDAVEVRNPILGGDERWAVPLAGPANRQGRAVADNIYGGDRKYKGTYGASVVRVFDLMIACVGLNEKMCRAKDLSHSSVHVHPGSHAGYFPGAKSISFKLVFNPEDGTVYGAQAVGEDGVEKRIDVVSTAMQGGLKVDDLADIELCYAPPVGSAKDPVNIAGMAAQNVVEGLVSRIGWSELESVAASPDVAVLDVRNPGEVERNGLILPGAINIPLNDLRSRIDAVPRDKRIIVSCASGQRAYYACRILKQRGFEMVDNLSGAFKTYRFVRPLPN